MAAFSMLLFFSCVIMKRTYEPKKNGRYQIMLMMYLSTISTQEEKNKFEQLYHTYERKMYAVAYKILKNPEDAEDVVHDSFQALIENLDKIQEIHCHKTWNYIVTIVKNKAITRYNKKKKYTTGELEEEYFQEESSEDSPVYEYVEKQETAEIVAKLILELPEQYRYVIYLYYYNELPFAEVAKTLEITESNARQIANRARKLLEKRLRERGITHG